jgi:ParB-like chromosome segregation protein Spo0J
VSQAEVWIEPEPPGDVVSVAVADLDVHPTFRAGGLRGEHVEQLVEAGGSWPPILVGRRDGRVIDGAHRVAAARRLGLERIEARLFDGAPEDAFVEFVRRNVVHGLTLTLGERKRAGTRVLRAHPRWSDRRVAELCALSPKTVARLRPAAGACPTEEGTQSDAGTREGRDRRVRPVRRGSVRARVVEALRARPDASLRAIAGAVGVSPETVRLVRLNLAATPEAPAARAPEPWRSDAALSSGEQAASFLEWFERTAIGPPEVTWAESVPLSRVYVVAEEARRRSELWLRFARAVEARPNRGNSPPT